MSEKTGDRRDEDDTTAAASYHRGTGGLSKKECTREVDREDSLPVIFLDFENGAPIVDTDGVQKYIQSAELLECVINGNSTVITLAQVDNRTADSDAIKSPQLVDQRGHPFGTLIDYEDIGTGCGESSGARPSEPSRTGHQHATAA